jgi:hypothetical protein
MPHIKTLQEAKDNSTLNDITDNPDGVLTDNSDYDNSNVNYTQSFTETPFDILTSQVEFDKNNNIIYDKTTGRPVESTKYDFDVDFTWLNNSDNLQPDTVLHYEVDNDYKSKELKDDGKPVFDNSKQSSNSKLIMVVHYINGKTEEKNPSNRKIVGVVKAHGKQLQDPNLKQLREDITKENPGTGTFTFSKTTTIIEKHKGRFWTIKGQRKPVHEAFAPNQPMVFGIVRYTADGMHRLEVPNIENYYQNEETGAVRNIYTDPQQLIPGTVHAIIESTNGDLVSYPLYTRKVKEVPASSRKG